MIKKLIFFITLISNIIFSSCTSQVISNKDLQGNWYLMTNSEINVPTYTEIFIDGRYIYYFTDRFGLKPRSKYYIKNNILFQSRFNSDMEKFGELTFGDSTFSIKSNTNKAVFKRINDSINLEGLINEKYNENNYRKSFIWRLKKWQE